MPLPDCPGPVPPRRSPSASSGPRQTADVILPGAPSTRNVSYIPCSRAAKGNAAYIPSAFPSASPSASPSAWHGSRAWPRRAAGSAVRYGNRFQHRRRHGNRVQRRGRRGRRTSGERHHQVLTLSAFSAPERGAPWTSALREVRRCRPPSPGRSTGAGRQRGRCRGVHSSPSVRRRISASLRSCSVSRVFTS